MSHDIDAAHRPGVPARALISAGHPGPSLAITAMIVLLTTVGSPDSGTLAVFAIAVLAGELSIGWSNDVFDAAADAAAGRTDKPIVVGAISRHTVAVAAGIGLLVGAVGCFAVSPATGVINLAMIAAGWAYNAGLKGTLASGLMYVIGFGLIPAFAASVLPGHPAPRAWVTAVAALLGLGGHFANALPDLATDRASGVRGLPQRIAGTRGGGQAVRLTALALLFVATLLVVLAPGRALRWWDVLGLGAAVVLAAVGAVAKGRTPFFAAIGIAALDLVLFVSRGAALI